MPGRLSSAKEILLLLLLGVAGQSFDSYSDLGLFYRFAVGKTYTSKFNDMPSPCIMRIPLLSGRFEKSSNIHLVWIYSTTQVYFCQCGFFTDPLNALYEDPIILIWIKSPFLKKVPVKEQYLNIYNFWSQATLRSRSKE